MNRILFVAGILLTIVLVSCTKQINEPSTSPTSQTQELIATGIDQAAPPQTPHKPYVANELLVKFVTGLISAARSNALARVSGDLKAKVLTRAMQAIGDDEGFFVVHTPLAVLDAI